MKGLCLYVKAGKGHYVPAKAINEQLGKLGVESRLIDFFDYLDLEWLENINQRSWRFLLRFPSFERHFIKSVDNSRDGKKMAVRLVRSLRKKKLISNINEFYPDFILTTHPYPATVMSTLLKSLGYNIPVYYYATDVFTSPSFAICPNLRKFYIATQEGVDDVRSRGLSDEQVVLCPFPLQESVANQPRLSKKEARKKIGIDESMFTMQLNLGGEGLGSLSLLESIVDDDLPVQVVVIGGINDEMKNRLKKLVTHVHDKRPKIIIRGFIDNVYDYLAAADVIVGRAGINTILEAIYAHRPFIITEVVYTVIPSADYVEKYKVGWNASEGKQMQVDILRKLLSNPSILDDIDRNFDKVPIEFSALKLANMLKDDASDFKNIVTKNGF